MDYKQLAAELLTKMPTTDKLLPQRAIHSDAMLLMHLECRDKVLPKEISDALGVSTARVAVVLNELEEKGYITREIDSQDRRQIIVKITAEGEKARAEQKQRILNQVTEFLNELGEHDAKEYVRIMCRLADIYRKKVCQ